MDTFPLMVSTSLEVFNLAQKVLKESEVQSYESKDRRALNEAVL